MKNNKLRRDMIKGRMHDPLPPHMSKTIEVEDDNSLYRDMS